MPAKKSISTVARKRINTSSSSPLLTIPNVGKATVADLHLLGIHTIDELADKNSEELYERLCHLSGVRHDPCVLDVLESAVAYARDGHNEPWWFYSRKRKATH